MGEVMLPLWLTPQIIKGGILAAIIGVIFFAGWGCKGKLDASKIQRMKSKVQTVENNYDLCLADVERSQENYETLRTAIEAASAEALAANESYRERMDRMRESNRAAIVRLNASHDATIGDMVVEADHLREVMATMSAAEACNLAMLEIVK
jgi:outer membrane murein-binding lipoprotein Lpp